MSWWEWIALPVLAFIGCFLIALAFLIALGLWPEDK